MSELVITDARAQRVAEQPREVVALGRVQATAAINAHYGSLASMRAWGRVSSATLTIARLREYDLGRCDRIIARERDAAKVALSMLADTPIIASDEPEVDAAISALLDLVSVELQRIAGGL